MPLKSAIGFELLASTTGGGVPIGGTGNVDVSAIIIGSVAATVNIVANGVAALPPLAASVYFDIPIAMTGPVTATSSGGNFSITFRRKVT